MLKPNKDYTFQGLLRAGRGVLVTKQNGETVWAIRPGKPTAKRQRTTATKILKGK